MTRCTMPNTKITKTETRDKMPMMYQSCMHNSRGMNCKWYK